MGTGNINVRNNTARKPGQPLAELLATNKSSSDLRIETLKPLKTQMGATPRVCGAMAQQRCDSGRGNESAPQEFVHLVGYRNPDARPEGWVRPTPVKR